MNWADTLGQGNYVREPSHLIAAAWEAMRDSVTVDGGEEIIGKGGDLNNLGVRLILR